MKRALHIASLLVALVMASHAFAVGGQAVLVCKFSGKVMKNCPCPEPRESTHSEVERTGCCELSQSDAGQIPMGTPLPTPATVVGQLIAPPSELPGLILPSLGTNALLAKGTSPPRGRTPLYVQLRQLLI